MYINSIIATTRDRDSKENACFPKALKNATEVTRLLSSLLFLIINGKERERENMNREEWLATYGRNGRNKWYIRAHKILEVWKIENNISEMCDIHHRNDTTESIKYNEEHYDLWGFERDENGDYKFELGKYVVFMTHREHAKYHGKFCSEQTRKKISANTKGEKNPFWGKKHTPETLAKISNALKGRSSPRRGTKMTEGQKQKLRDAHKKLAPKTSERQQAAADLYKRYKSQGYNISWNDFQRALKNNEINIE